KQHSDRLARVAGLILFMQLVYEYFEVMPAFRADRLVEHWMDFLTPVGIGGLWLAAFLFTWPRWPILPLHDGNHAQAQQLRENDEEEAAFEEALSHG
ncbi:MAG: hypothetical protein JJ992_10035, partial [Planctomycetes bacterium]|nr:hypothetical protein [Planctomycetota bacterium]